MGINKADRFSSIIWTISGIALGVASILSFCAPGALLIQIVPWLGSAMLLSGVCNILLYCREWHKGKTGKWMLADGLTAALLSCFLLFNQMVIAAVIPFFFCVWELFSGVIRLCNDLLIEKRQNRMIIIESNPADRIERPKKIRFEGSIYNVQELDKLFCAFAGDPLELGVLLSSFYGLRRSEVLGLKWSAVDFKAKTICVCHVVTKTTLDEKSTINEKECTTTKLSCRTLPLVPSFSELRTRLKAQQEMKQKLCGDSYQKKYLEYICVNEIEELIKPNYITQHFPIVLKKSGLRKIRFHDLRPSCASLLYKNGVSLKEIQEWLGIQRYINNGKYLYVYGF